MTMTYRGFMLDVSRHFMPVGEIRKLLEAAHVLGLNVMHWHLTDDQGWRMEIRKYPRLTEIGSVRGRSGFGGADPEENNSGFYTQEEIRDLVEYAGGLGIGILPEIEIPGHASALLAAIPEAGCRRGESGKWKTAVEKTGGIFPALVCAGKDEALQILRDILDEVTELFPYPAVHIGGDEAAKIRWRRCPDCQRRMRELSLESEDALQRWLVLQIGEYLAGKGRKTVVWNDVLAGGLLPPHFIVQHWTGQEEETREFMRRGGRVICSDTASYYFDYPYGKIDVRTIHDYPLAPAYAEGYEDRQLGLECPLWTEHISNLSRAAYMLFPRLTAVSLKMAGRGDLPLPAFLDEVRRLQGRVEALGLQGAPESCWNLPEEEARRNCREWERACQPEAGFQQEGRIMALEQAERLMKQIGIPEGFARQAGELALAELYGEPAPPDPDGAGTMIHQLMDAGMSRLWGAWAGIPEKIWLDTMKCYTRFIGEHRRACGRDGFDRGAWTVRQTEARLFRIGELEYELCRKAGPEIALHIPSDTVLEPERLNDSLREARAFLAARFPEFAQAPVTCESWLLSPVLRELLPENSRILRFQQAFDLTETDPADDAALEWVFHLTAAQREGLELRTLPEETTLQRRMKRLLLEGKHPGSARGKLVRPF